MNPELLKGRIPANKGKRYPPEPLSHDEVARLLAACPHRGLAGIRNRAIIVTIWRCGLRIAEALSLAPHDVDLKAGTVRVRRGKGDKTRVVGIDPQATAVIERWLQARAKLRPMPRAAPLFCTISRGNIGHRVHSAYFREALKAYAAQAGIDKRVHPHGFRHTHAVELLREGAPLTVIQKQLGHSNLATTARYLDHLLPREVIERMQGRVWPDELAA
jgi:site-specific recombinase XerD